MDRRTFLASSSLLYASRHIHAQGAIAADTTIKEVVSPNLILTPKTPDQWELTFKLSRAIRILQVTDTHFSSTAEKDQFSMRTLDALLRLTKPDFIVHTGDFVNNDTKDPVTWEGVDYFNKLKLPWALCFGNHDYPVADATGSLKLDDYRQSLRNCAMGYAEVDSKRHYCYRHDLKTRGDKPSASLFYFQVGYRSGDRKISDPQLEWFDAQMKADAMKGWNGPILVFVHIPLIEYDTMLNNGKATGGFKNEKVCFDSDTGVSFKAFAASKRVKGVFCGHDHVNNFFGTWEGIALHYGRVSGWGSYGKWERGGRLISLDPATGRFSQKEVTV